MTSETAAAICGGLSFWCGIAENENGALRFRKEHAIAKNKKAGIIRPFAIRLRISASTSVVKGKGGTAARLIMKG
ncbi:MULTISPECIES: hypothetical protein [unclassified Rhizobium]|uniref:hypothetical protein n=1 Tax=unclassified Rhizobium TaxID=2613769 RepID=UPI000647A72C|nr:MULTISPECIES: hypothetical protein [unclassified Rhizobium]MBN8953830.1 hypothetical protein [Rhizobium tropici]OJY72365.1 MAG: hypothetical protein BGP09_04410 [Rhizobium sp. 60-20]